MSIWLHLPIMAAVESVLMLAAVVLPAAVLLAPLYAIQEVCGPDALRGWPLPVILLGMLLGVWLARRSRGWIRAAFRDVVPARCPACGRLAAYARGGRPVRYECRACLSTTKTGLYEVRGGVGED